ncbi:hypothetical protein FGO68_gene3601 [Halteria grandinella]|uniref:Uncharacterized protein n=1 Tax=Halteria grandinella TaxID=5974 RepID=A0A8J8NBX3_HALGN|nr:hypothetical protein FGO68_gene3601 [Halteria grandinella]
MGNCAGIFSNCKGDDTIAGANDGVVKKIDRDQMNKALAANSQEISSNAFGRPAKGSTYPQQQWDQHEHTGMMSDGGKQMDSGQQFSMNPEHA